MGNIQVLLENQFKSYFLKRKSGRNGIIGFKPCITISQENGSGGRTVARNTAKIMGFRFYDKEIIEMIAAKSHLKRKLIESIDEKTQDTIESIVNSFLGVEAASEHTYIKSLAWVVLTIANKGNAVILGRGGNFIIPSGNALRVRIISPIKSRILNSSQYEYPGISLDKVREKIIKVHLERKEFIRKYFSKDISNANYYDLVINTQYITIEQANKIVITAFRERFGL